MDGRLNLLGKVLHSSRIGKIYNIAKQTVNLYQPRLQNVGKVEGSAERHVVQVQQRRPVGKHRVDVDLFNVGQMRDGVLWQLEISDVHEAAVVLVGRPDLVAHVVKVVSVLPEGLRLAVLGRYEGETVDEEENDRELAAAPGSAHPAVGGHGVGRRREAPRSVEISSCVWQI
jgi:hypothetical protein